ncbi:hypothetical protein [uncultured Microbacterium sp.]|uniref:hypothetical protein n=1 Tax=uncultured Microbacterium sp. TaxID=191216 RepID=UPI0028DC2608|nr:hypothetical protein [uncultured Microbacterium sp.]
MSSDATTGLIRALVENLENAPEDWESFAMIVSFFEGEFSGAAGYAYSPDGSIAAVTVDPWAVKSAVADYTDSHYTAGAPLPVKFLVQFDRSLGRFEVTFEDMDDTRWQVTPRTFKTLREELRPRFD